MARAAVVLLLLQGCAFGLQGPDPNRTRNELPKCDTGKGLVVLDGTMAALLGVSALGIAANDGGGLALLPAAIGAIYVGGAMGEFEQAYAARRVLPEGNEQAQQPPVSATAAPPAAPTAAPPASGPPPQTVPPPAVAVRSVSALAPPQGAPPAAAPTSAAPPSPPVAAKMPGKAPGKTAPNALAKPEPDDDWTAFWREVPQ
jgi:hypothetical protein